jgi:hypothetical protein
VVEFADKFNYLGKRAFVTLDVVMKMLGKIGERMKAFKPADIDVLPVPTRTKDYLALSFQGNAVKKALDGIAGVRFDASAASAGKFTSTIRIIGPAAQQAARGIRAIGTEVALALGVVGLIYKITQATVAYFKTAIGGARDLAETQNKVKEIFGATSGVVTANAERMASAYKLPKGEILDAASNIGLLAKGAGQSTAASAQLSSVMVEAAANASSFYNVPFADALDKIRSGLTGEARPLKDFGILMDESAVKAEGMKLGFIKAGQELNEQGKIAARSSIILRGLSTANGDLERTQDGVANQLRALHGNFVNNATAIGGLFLPAVQKGLAVMLEFSSATSGTFEAIKAGVEPMVETFVAGLDMIGLVLRNLPEYGQIAWLGIKEGVYNTIAVIEVIPENLGRIGTYLAGNWKEVIVDAVTAVWTVFQNLGNNIGELWHAITHVFESGEWSPNFKPLLEGFAATAAQLPEMAKPQFVSMADDIKAVMDKVAANEARRVVKREPNAKPELPKLAGGAEKKESKDKEVKTAAAAELGSKEAASTIAKFMNQSKADESNKATAKNTAAMARHTMTMAQALGEIAHRGGSDKLSAFTL